MIEVNFPPNGLAVVRSALLESYAGYAGGFIPEFLDSTNAQLEQLWKIVDDTSKQENTLTLPKKEWRLIFEAINVVIYELGPEELHTITGYELNEFLNTGRVIYASVYKRSNTRTW